MQRKYSIVYGFVDGKGTLLRDAGDYEEHRRFVKELSENGGRLPGAGKRGAGAQVDDVTIFHSTQGVLKKRSMKPRAENFQQPRD
jgi:hypothetical protein